MTDTIETPNFSDMSIGQLRQYASHLRIALAKTATKPDIIEAIENKLNGRVVPEFAHEGSQVKPGYAKIRLLEDPMPGASNLPAYINANGYVATIPRGVDVIVPMRVVRTLNYATVNKRKQTLVVDPQTGRETFRESTVTVPSYPFQVIEMTPGPEVLTAHERSKQRSQRLRKAYRAMFKRWPGRQDLTRAIEQGLIKLEAEDVLPAGVELKQE